MSLQIWQRYGIILITILAVPVCFHFASANTSAETSPPAKIRILIVPGHDALDYGAKFKNLKEADVNLAVAEGIYSRLANDPRFEVVITRDKNGYTPVFRNYFANNTTDIEKFIEDARAETRKAAALGTFNIKKSDRPAAKSRVVFKLFGTNKWANENNIDAVVNIHFNDYPRKRKTAPGKYTGFNIYIPERELQNYAASAKLAAQIFSDLKKNYKVSNYPKDAKGIVEDQALIALGAKNSLYPNIASILIEYGYLYEKRFKKQSALELLAERTASSIKNYFSTQSL